MQRASRAPSSGFGSLNAGPSKVGKAIRGMDFYRKVPREFSEGTLGGSIISILSAVLMLYLFLSELGKYSTSSFETKVVVDRSVDGELLRINFNLSFPALSCEFASVDVGDALGLNRFNLTKTVFKRAIDAEMNPIGPLQWDRAVKEVLKASDEEHEQAVRRVEEHKKELALLKESNSKAADGKAHVVYEIDDLNSLQAMVHDPTHAVVLVNFYAPWCPWCQRLEPVYEAAGLSVHEKYPPGTKQRVLFTKIDCVVHEKFCMQQVVTGYPTIRIFTHGTDILVHDGKREHAFYKGPRTVDALTQFVDTLVPKPEPVSQSSIEAAREANFNLQLPASVDVQRRIMGPGCAITGFVLVKKVPGHLWISASSPDHSFHGQNMNMTHVVNHFYFGHQLSDDRRRYLEKFHAGEKAGDWHDRLAGQTFVSESAHISHEHYLQTVLTSIAPRGRFALPFSVYEYTQHAHAVHEPLPKAKFHYQPSPMQIAVSEERMAFYSFITSLMAIIGGVYSVMGIADGVLFNSIALVRKKLELGKQI
ncbi:Thioredoxin/protein disulfide isomerase [Ostreococcus tauri]|uniref:Thioredoxin/protein disulfide isomerase n=2 Tax=Ostreococcus tauri TaxID=70448 RepID=A0A1Y5IJH8_OSTTA|nr:Thioredoxin/protein disulfide isomerase [Ostreococcus tauri]